MTRPSRVFTFFCAACVLVAAARRAYCYIDPGTGSYLLQIAIAGIVGAAFAAKVFWRSIAASIGRFFGKKPPSDGSDDTQ